MTTGDLGDFWRFHVRLGPREILRGVDYVRCLEYPMVFEHLQPRRGGRLLDIGSGHSAFPLYVATRTGATVVSVDPSAWVTWQRTMARRLQRQGLVDASGHRIVLADARDMPLRDQQFDYISMISMIEHVEGDGDTAVMQEIARLLKPEGRLVLTTPYNYRTYREFFVAADTYTAKYRDAPLFYQRHYDDDALTNRLVEPSGLTLRKKLVCGEPGARCFNTLFANPRLPLLLKAPYLWLTPLFVRRFARRLRDDEIATKKDLPMITTEFVLLVLEKPALALRREAA